MSSRAGRLASLFVAVAFLPGCITSLAAEELPNEVEVVHVPALPGTVRSISGASVVVEPDGARRIIVEARCLDRSAKFFTAVVASRTSPVPSSWTFEPADVAALSTLSMPVRFVAAGDGDALCLNGSSTDWGRLQVSADPAVLEQERGARPITEREIERAALVETRRVPEGILIHASLPGPGGRTLGRVRIGGVRTVEDAGDDTRLLLPAGDPAGRTEYVRHRSGAGTVAFIILVPFTIAADVVFCVPELIGLIFTDGMREVPWKG